MNEKKTSSKKILTTTVISAMVLLALLAVFTTSASAYCNSGSNDVLVTNPGGTSGGAYPYSSTTQSETTVTYTTINAALLANYDTFVMWRVCGGHLNQWTTSQKQDIVDWVYAGGKLIIWDTECTGNPDYTWLPYSFVTSNPGAMGARRCPLTVVEENTLSSLGTTSPYYIDTNTICQNTDAVGDANILTTYSSSWCQDMEAINYYGVTGPVHVYAHYGSGLMIYCGLDADYMGWGSTGAKLEQVLLNELAQTWGDEACGLPCGAPIPPGVLTVDKTGDKTTMNIGETVTFTITVENVGTSTITGITLQDILPPELSTTDPTTWNIGTLNPGATATRTLTATAIASGSAQNVAKAMGTDAAGNPVGSDDTFTVTITANQAPVADAGLDQVVEQDSLGGASVTLDGSGSTDDGRIQPLTYTWTWAGGSATGVSPTVILPLGTTTVTLTVYDGQYSDTDTVDITVQDTTPSVISLVGADPQTIECGDAYTELGATATDVCCGDLTTDIVIDASAVDTSTVGSYTVTYDVIDCNGNPAVQVTRTVNVVDTTPPVISVVGADPQTIECGDAYTELGATATDVCCGDLTANIVIDTSAVDTSTVGSYTVTYDVTDCNGNHAVQVTRTVNVVDTTPPVITCPADVTVEQETRNGTVVPLTATATDICDADPTITSNELPIYPLGTTTVTFTATDNSGNSASCSMNVTVVLWPVINKELDALKGNVSNATMPRIIKHRLVDKLEYAKELKDNAKEECEAGNFDGATKKLGVAKSQVESFESMVRITRRISPEDKASFLEKSAEIKWKIDTLIEYIETEHKC